MLSFVLPVRQEYPQATWTVYSLINDVPEGEDFEVILCANACDQKNLDWLDWFSRSGLGRKKRLRVLVRSEAGIMDAYRQGFAEAKGDVIVCGCSHSAVTRDSIRCMFNLLKAVGGVIHAPMLWMGDYCPPNGTYKLMQFKDPIYGGWTFHAVRQDPYTVASSGLGLTMFDKAEYFDLGGAIPKPFSVYGGFEYYLNLKYWLLGKKVWVHPKALYYHWAYERSWRQNQKEKQQYSWNIYFTRNMLIGLYCLGGAKWLPKVFPKAVKQPFWQKLLAELPELCREERQLILNRQVYDGLDGLFKAEPWDYPKKNVNNVKSY